MKKKIKVMHVLASSSFSGAENVAITIIEHTVDAIESIYVSQEGPIKGFLEEKGIHNELLKKLSFASLRRTVRKEKPDIIHAHDFKASVLSGMVTSHIPVISHIHNNAPWLRKVCFKSVLYGAACLRIDWVFTVSKSITEEYVFGNYIKKKTTVVGNPIDVKQIKEKASQSREKEEYDIIFLGRLSLPKNPLYFVEIVKKIADTNSKVQVAMVGDGELRDDVEKKIRDLNLTDNIRMYGFMKNPYGILARSKVLCLPSLWEGFGLVAVEAMSMGKPVVCSGVGGLQDIVQEECGSCCKSLDEYVQEINRLLTDGGYYEKVSSASLKRSMKYDNREKYICEISQKYFKLHTHE